MSRRPAKLIVLAALAGFSFTTPSLFAGTVFQSLGSAGPLNWSVLTLVNTSTVSVNGVINGNIGIAGSSGDLLLANSPTVVNGNVYMQAGASILNPQSVNGAIYSGQDLSLASQDALNASTIFAQLAPTLFLPGNSINGNTVINSQSALTVIDLNSINLNSGQTLTIKSAANTQVVVNVSGGMNLNNASIKLAGGIGVNDVIFNFTGSGLQLSATGQSAINALVLAPYRSIAFSAGVMHSELIAGGPSVLLGGALTAQTFMYSGPGVPEPGTFVLIAVGLIGLALTARRRSLAAAAA